MKLAILLFISNDCDEVIPKLEEYYEFIVVKESDFKDKPVFEHFSFLLRKYKAIMFITVGNFTLFHKTNLPFEWRKKWIHLRTLKDFHTSMIPNCYLKANFNHEGDKDHPLLSIVTTTFHSGDKILRPLNALLNQTYNNWEWIIWDDSKDDKTYHELLKMQDKDIRIQVYKKYQHSGFIGEMKRLSSNLCKGKWIIEIDHDDEVTPDLFQTIVDIDRIYPKCGFIYSDFIEIHENSLEPFDYGEQFAFGYGCYHKELIKGKFQNVFHSVPINPNTLSYIVGVPNHVRIWKKDFYHKIGNHNPALPVVDDYELILRTFLESECFVRIPKCCYLQYRNSGGNNFTFIRNGLIQHLTRWTYFQYKDQIENKWKQLGYTFHKQDSLSWLSSKKEYKRFEIIYEPKADSHISIILYTYNDIKGLINSIESIINQTDPNWILYIIGNKCPTLNLSMNHLLKSKSHLFDKIKWWNTYTHYFNPIHCLNYGVKMLVNTTWVTYLLSGNTWSTNHINDLRPKLLTSDFILDQKDINQFTHKVKLMEDSMYWNGSIDETLDKYLPSIKKDFLDNQSIPSS